MFNIPRVPFLLVCNISAGHDGKFGCNNVEYTTVRLYCDWLNFLWHGVKACMQSFVQLILYKVASFPELGFIFLINKRVQNLMRTIIFFVLQKQRSSFYISDDTKTS